LSQFVAAAAAAHCMLIWSFDMWPPDQARVGDGIMRPCRVRLLAKDGMGLHPDQGKQDQGLPWLRMRQVMMVATCGSDSQRRAICCADSHPRAGSVARVVGSPVAGNVEVVTRTAPTGLKKSGSSGEFDIRDREASRFGQSALAAFLLILHVAPYMCIKLVRPSRQASCPSSPATPWTGTPPSPQRLTSGTSGLRRP
jgi:hypothetical protein